MPPPLGSAGVRCVVVTSFARVHKPPCVNPGVVRRASRKATFCIGGGHARYYLYIVTYIRTYVHTTYPGPGLPGSICQESASVPYIHTYQGWASFVWG